MMSDQVFQFKATQDPTSGLFGLLHISLILFAYIIFTISNTLFYLPNIFLSHIHHITKSTTVKISQIIPNNLQSKQNISESNGSQL